MFPRFSSTFVGRRLVGFAAVFIAALTFAAPRVTAQSDPTEIQQVQIQTFVLGDATWTQYNKGRNIGVTPGANLIFRSFFGVSPGFEVRATLPVDSGTQAGLYSYLAGVSLTIHRGRVHPYANFLLGLGKIKFVNPSPGYPSDNSKVYQYDVGADIDMLRRGLALRTEFSLQQWNIGNTNGGGVFTPFSASVGLRYRFAARTF